MKMQKNSLARTSHYVILITILGIGFFLRVFKLDTHMMFIGDFAWFYFSAQKILDTGIIPLVGITSSQTWLHQGALWTYMIAPVIKLSPNPLSVGYFSVVLGMFAILLIYKVGSEMFSRKVGYLAALLFATSPLVIIFSRMPYHTSPIPLLSALFIWVCYRWIKFGWRNFPLVVGVIALLYNFELATVVVIPVLFFLGYFVYGKFGLKGAFGTKNILRSVLLFIIPMLPILIYDFNNGFLQTLKFAHWSIYLRVIKPMLEGTSSSLDIFGNTDFYFTNFQRLIFLHDGAIAFLILIAIVMSLAIKLLFQHRMDIGEIILWAVSIIPITLFLFNGTRSDAYLPLLFAPVILLIAVVLTQLFEKKTIFLTTLVLVIGVINAITLVQKNYLMETPHGYGLTYQKREYAVAEIERKAQSKVISITGGEKGVSNLTLPYEYILAKKGFVFDTKSRERFEIYELLDSVNVQYK